MKYLLVRVLDDPTIKPEVLPTRKTNEPENHPEIKRNFIFQTSTTWGSGR